MCLKCDKNAQKIKASVLGRKIFSPADRTNPEFFQVCNPSVALRKTGAPPGRWADPSQEL